MSGGGVPFTVEASSVYVFLSSQALFRILF